ncbi:MAG: hypothetical protein KGI27_12750 [Thaumarchaeota archaeon]|nr:hypothetical protein [Nitrososphaerota archaeon]
MVPIKGVSGLLFAETPLQTYTSSDLIVVGKVTSLEKISNFTIVEYKYNIQVEQYVKNPLPNQTITVIGKYNSIPSSPKFEIGQRALFLLDKEDANYIISPNSSLVPDGCNSHQMLGFRAFPDEPLPGVNLQDRFTVDKNCLDPLIEINPSMDLIFSPLKQFKAGTAAEDIACEEGYILIINSQDGFPACVTPDTANKLVMKGWNPSPINKITNDGLDPVYYVGEKIDFAINFKGFVSSCDYPHVSIVDSNQNTVWKGNNLALLCDPEMGLHPVYVNQTYQLSGGLGGPVAINQTGDYTTQILWYDQKLDTGFTVISSH